MEEKSSKTLPDILTLDAAGMRKVPILAVIPSEARNLFPRQCNILRFAQNDSFPLLALRAPINTI
jgi:hypothetical protein